MLMIAELRPVPKFINILCDQYPDLDALCDDLGADKEKIIQSLGSIGYEYNSELNRFC